MNKNKRNHYSQQEQLIVPSHQGSLQTKPNLLVSILSACLPSRPVPLAHPTCDIEDLPTIPRITESIIYFILLVEYNISPKGGLRQWIKMTLSLALLIGIPIACFLPIVEGLKVISISTVLILENILKSIGLVVAISASLYAIYRFILNGSSKRSSDKRQKIGII
jgi:hypothetical protein